MPLLIPIFLLNGVALILCCFLFMWMILLWQVPIHFFFNTLLHICILHFFWRILGLLIFFLGLEITHTPKSMFSKSIFIIFLLVLVFPKPNQLLLLLPYEDICLKLMVCHLSWKRPLGIEPWLDLCSIVALLDHNLLLLSICCVSTWVVSQKNIGK